MTWNTSCCIQRPEACQRQETAATGHISTKLCTRVSRHGWKQACAFRKTPVNVSMASFLSLCSDTGPHVTPTVHWQLFHHYHDTCQSLYGTRQTFSLVPSPLSSGSCTLNLKAGCCQSSPDQSHENVWAKASATCLIPLLYSVVLPPLTHPTPPWEHEEGKKSTKERDKVKWGGEGYA